MCLCGQLPAWRRPGARDCGLWAGIARASLPELDELDCEAQELDEDASNDDERHADLRFISLPGRSRAPRRRPESEVDRGGLAGAVSDRLAELGREGVSQAAAAQRARCGISTLRNMQNGTGTSHYGHELLRRVAIGLGLPADRLVKAFYPPVPRDPVPPSDAEVMVQRVLSQLEPYLDKINAIPGMQTGVSGMQRDVEGLQERIKSMARDVHEVRSRLETFVDINHLPPAG